MIRDAAFAALMIAMAWTAQGFTPTGIHSVRHRAFYGAPVFQQEISSAVTRKHRPRGRRSHNEYVNQPILTWHERAHRLFDSAEEGRVVIRDDHPFFLTYEALFGVPRHVLREYVAIFLPHETYLHSRGRIRRWKSWKHLGGQRPWSLPRGKDIFIQGMGSFEVQAAYQRIVDRRLRLHKEQVLWQTLQDFGELPSEIDELTPAELLDAHTHDSTFHYAMESFLSGKTKEGRNSAAMDLRKQLLLEQVDLYGGEPYWYVTIPQLWVEGYFPELLEDCAAPIYGNNTVRDAVIGRAKLRDQYVEIEGGSTYKTVAEILKADGGKIFPIDRSPPELRRHFIKYLDAWKQHTSSLCDLSWFLPYANDDYVPDNAQAWLLEWPSRGMSLKPKQLLEWIHNELQLKLNTRFHFLDKLADTPNLKVLRSTYGIIQVGKALQNCAVDYTGHVERQECVLVAYYNDGKNQAKPLALGMFPLKADVGCVCEDPSELGEWSEVAMARNELPTAKVLQSYDEYTATIQRFKKQSVPF